MGALADELRKKYRTPSEALVALGLDASILKSDSKLKQKEPEMSKKVLSRFGGASAVAMGFYLEPRMAADAKIDLTSIFDGVTKKNFAERKAKIAADIKAKAVLAKDANLDDMHTFIDRLEKADVAEGADEDPSSGQPMSKEDMDKKAKDESEAAEKKKADDKKSARDAFLTEKGMKAEDIAALDAMEACDEPGEKAEENAGGKEGAGAKKGAEDSVSKAAMDAAIKKTAEDTAITLRNEMREAAEAREFVRPWAGALSMALDSAEAIHRAALDAVGVKHTGFHKDALKPILEAQPKPGEAHRSQANDAVPARTGFDSRWGANAERIGGVN